MDKFIAYKTQDFDDAELLETSSKWHKRGLISKETLSSIEAKYAFRHYSPGIFTRIGIFIFTWLGYSAVGGLFGVSGWNAEF